MGTKDMPSKPINRVIEMSNYPGEMTFKAGSTTIGNDWYSELPRDIDNSDHIPCALGTNLRHHERVKTRMEGQID